MTGSKRSAPATVTADEPAPPLAAGLYLVATPIGNLRDITLRALDVLAGSDLIACEDTRVTGVLLQRHGIATPTTPYHEHNAAKVRPGLVARLKAGARIALVSDAGTPLISDPGYRLVAEAREAGVSVTAVPGASSVLAALCVAGLPTDRFTFAGFLPAKSGARDAAVAGLAAAPGSLVLFESARRLPETLAALAQGLGPRPAAVCRELTKLHEEVRRDSLPALAEHYRETGAPRGEVVLVIGPAGEAEAADDDAIDAALRPALESMSVRDAADAVAAALAAPRRKVYARALALAGDGRR